MQVVFLQTVKGIGQKNQIKNVSDGYARNFLIPRKLAAPATSVTVKNVEAAHAQAQADDKAEMDRVAKMVKDLKAKKLEFMRGAPDSIIVEDNRMRCIYKPKLSRADTRDRG